MTDLTNEQWVSRLNEIDEIAKQNIAVKREEKIYCFLDFDGVINIWNRPVVEHSIKEKEFQMLSEECVHRLSSLCQSYPIEIVISSSWRFQGLQYCQYYLLTGGLDKNIPVVGTTALDLDVDREMHITDYLLEHPDYTNYFILDDINLKHLQHHLIQCDIKIGFDDTKHNEAVKMLEQLLNE